MVQPGKEAAAFSQNRAGHRFFQTLIFLMSSRGVRGCGSTRSSDIWLKGDQTDRGYVLQSLGPQHSLDWAHVDRERSLGWSTHIAKRFCQGWYWWRMSTDRPKSISHRLRCKHSCICELPSVRCSSVPKSWYRTGMLSTRGGQCQGLQGPHQKIGWATSASVREIGWFYRQLAPQCTLNARSILMLGGTGLASGIVVVIQAWLLGWALHVHAPDGQSQYCRRDLSRLVTRKTAPKCSISRSNGT